MATPSTLQQIAFAGGFDESQRAEVLDPASAFVNIENARQDSRGGHSMRLGFTSLVNTRLDATSRTTGTTMFSHKGVPCVVDAASSPTLDAYSEAAAAWVGRGTISEANFTLVDTQALSGGSNTAAGGALTSVVVDIARAGSYIAVAHSAQPGTGGNGIYVSVQDKNGNIVKSITRLAQGTVVETTCALASYSDRYIIAFLVDGNSANIQAWYLDTNTAATLTTGWVSLGNVATDHVTSGTSSTAISTESLTDRVAFAYINTTVNDKVTVKTVNVAGIIQTRTLFTNAILPTTCALEGSIADTLWVSWNEGTAVRVHGIDADALSVDMANAATIMTLSSGTAFTVLGLVSKSAAGTGYVISNDGSGFEDRMHYRAFKTTAGAATTDGVQFTLYNSNWASRPFQINSRFYALVHPDNVASSNAQKRLFLADFTGATTWVRAVASVEPSLATASSQSRAHWVTDGTNTNTRLVPFSVTRSGVATAPRIATFNFAPQRSRPAAHAGASYIDGGLLSVFDGERVTESGFLFHPAKPTTSLAGTGITGSFRYVTVYESIDASGNWVQSEVSDPSASVSPANQTVTVTARPLTITSRIRNTTNDIRERVAFYRTQTGGEPPYYRLASVISDPTAATVQYADSTTDATLSTNALLYGTGELPSTQGAGLDRMAPPGLRYLASFNGVLVGAVGSTIWHSSQYVEGEAPWFNPVFTVPIPEEITALEVQDGTLYAFTRLGVYAIAGEPPSDNGSSGGLGTPRRLAVNIGATSGVTLATDFGIVYRSERGIELLTRGGQSVEYFGEGVQDTLGSFPIVSAMTLDTKGGLIRISLAATESAGRVTGNGVDVVYDLTLRMWVSRDLKITASGTPAQSSAMIRVSGEWRFGWLAADGTIYYERLASDASAYLDASSFVVRRAESAWFKVSGLQGRQHLNRVMLLGKRLTAHGLKMFLAYDYNSTYKTAQTWTDSQITTIATDLPNLQVGHHGHDESPTQAARVKIETVAPTVGALGTGQSATWIGLTVDVTPQQGAYELPDTAV